MDPSRSAHGVPRPRIGVTRWEDVPGERLKCYWDRVRQAHGDVVDLGPDVGALAFDALILTGGLDIDPQRYGEPAHPKVRKTDPQRDEFELGRLLDALDRDVPVLAICRGHQLLNVALGGKLLQHIDGDGHRARLELEGQPSRWHTVRLAPGSRLRAILRSDVIEVNSRHHQAVTQDTLAPSLRALATSPDGLVEAVESQSHRWVIGVQWHPERPEPEHPDFAPCSRLLFDALVREAARAVQPA